MNKDSLKKMYFLYTTASKEQIEKVLLPNFPLEWDANEGWFKTDTYGSEALETAEIPITEDGFFWIVKQYIGHDKYFRSLEDAKTYFREDGGLCIEESPANF